MYQINGETVFYALAKIRLGSYKTVRCSPENIRYSVTMSKDNPEFSKISVFTNTCI